MAKKAGVPQKSLGKYIGRIDAAEKFRDSGYAEIFKRCFAKYRNYVEAIIDPATGKETDDSNISIPYTLVQVETILPRILETIFAARPYLSIKDREPNDLPNAQRMETLLDWQFNERMDCLQEFYTGIKSLCIFGTAVEYIGWRYEQRKVFKKVQQDLVFNGQPIMQNVPEVDPVSGQPIPGTLTQKPVQTWQKAEVNEIEWDDPTIKFLDLLNFFVDPMATNIDDARYCGHDEYKTKAQLNKMAEDGVIEPIDWKKAGTLDKGDNAREAYASAVGMAAPSTSEGVDDKDEDALVRVTHYWEDNKHVILLNRQYIALESENPFWHNRKPYRKANYILVPNEFYGMGIPELLNDLQDELNTERNMRIDFKAFLLRRMWAVRKGSGITAKDLRWRKGGVIEFDGDKISDELQPIEMPDGATFSSQNEEALIKADMRDATGGQDIVMGAGAGTQTATETMALDNNASMRFKLIVKHVENELLVGAARQIIQLNQQFLDAQRVLRVTGESGDEWLTVSPDDIQGEFDLFAVGSSVEPMANKEANKQRMVELYNLVSSDPMYQNMPNKRRDILKKVFDAFDLKDTDKLLPSDEELATFDQFMQFMQQQAMLQQAQQQGGPNLQLMRGSGSNQAMSPAMQEQGLQMMGGK